MKTTLVASTLCTAACVTCWSHVWHVDHMWRALTAIIDHVVSKKHTFRKWDRPQIFQQSDKSWIYDELQSTSTDTLIHWQEMCYNHKLPDSTIAGYIASYLTWQPCFKIRLGNMHSRQLCTLIYREMHRKSDCVYNTRMNGGIGLRLRCGAKT